MEAGRSDMVDVDAQKVGDSDAALVVYETSRAKARQLALELKRRGLAAIVVGSLVIVRAASDQPPGEPNEPPAGAVKR